MPFHIEPANMLIVIKLKHSFYLLSRPDLLGPAALRPLLVDFGLLPGSPHKLLAGTVNHHTVSTDTRDIYVSSHVTTLQ